MLIDAQKTGSNYHHGSVKEALLNAALLVRTQLHGIVTLRNSGLIGAAATHQNWHQKCALTDNAQMEKLVENRVQIMINSMPSNSRGKDNH
jgi:uncharacterized membrane protein